MVVTYEHGHGAAQSDVGAARCYRKAADQGYVDAQHNLGSLYGEGNGIAQSDSEAVRWYRKAAEQESCQKCKDIKQTWYHVFEGPRFVSKRR